MTATPTNHPVRKLGRQSFMLAPILSLDFIRSRCKFEMERDLSKEPTLLSGGDRKAQGKARSQQRSMLRVSRRVQRNPWLAAYGDSAVTCPRCSHMMLIDIDPAEPLAVTCDRCRSAI
jgi:hypothetical protein